ncbi:aminotransferase class I/II-fold pyridoxal phosphate-dependent enzyme [Heliophilum fasciatum]|uniref:Cystathionine beta-lyase family protein involved in aluminum resistance n=1 Tax=Heliophilum fasciatum TaxID=35700 RepID=A0A4R2RHE4_9FIRM|nr:methionine gamma-lyase family protein [Heliophilum fasciatum]MCW2278905.1 cystathionine beta-lyase family protein involved in aluminum resistance [Heliophilum fasciatum]TCP62038.1 cystathionine beta-lyase family protein involved in aluminum resistance [Heliophilum fasciatum]
MVDLFDVLVHEGKLDTDLAALARQADQDTRPILNQWAAQRDAHQWKILQAFQAERVSTDHLGVSTGYGYGDDARDTLDAVMARILGAEAALAREQFVSGTHAIATALFGVLRPGDELLAATGTPYDTLIDVIGCGEEAVAGSLKEWGVAYRQVELTESGHIDISAVCQALKPQTRVVLLQRSRGYSMRPSLSVREIGVACTEIKRVRPDVIVFVDNCYGELVEADEPTGVGADLIAGSLIKNLGGGLAPTGGYVAGRKEMVEKAATRLTAPGIGSHVGSSPAGRRLYFQGLFQAPGAIYEALAGAVFTSRLFELLGFEVNPRFDQPRYDIIQAITLGSAERIVAFCQGVQQASPIDGHVVPYPAPMPGYADPVIMAGGTFVQGSTIELSVDAPIRPPFSVYFQGGLAQAYVRIGVLRAAQLLRERKLLP